MKKLTVMFQYRDQLRILKNISDEYKVLTDKTFNGVKIDYILQVHINNTRYEFIIPDKYVGKGYIYNGRKYVKVSMFYELNKYIPSSSNNYGRKRLEVQSLHQRGYVIDSVSNAQGYRGTFSDILKEVGEHQQLISTLTAEFLELNEQLEIADEFVQYKNIIIEQKSQELKEEIQTMIEDFNKKFTPLFLKCDEFSEKIKNLNKGKRCNDVSIVGFGLKKPKLTNVRIQQERFL